MRLYSRSMKGVLALGTIAVASLAWAGMASAHSTSRPHKSHRRHEAHLPQVLYVSNSTVGGTAAADQGLRKGRSRHQRHQSPAGRGCSSAGYTTIGAAVAAASPHATIVVCPGSYPEDVVIPTGKPLTLEGVKNPIINAFNLDNGVQVLASNTTVEGFTIGYATGEGILVGAQPGLGGTVSGVTLRDNTVIDNDRGNPTGAPITSSSYEQCNGSAAGPGDCGEGVHLLSADNTTIVGNDITANSGGILISDENGPADGNVVASNTVSENALDCGITLAGHHLGTTTNGTDWTPVAPSAGGVFNNRISGNSSTNNGVLGQGGGVLMATGVPGGAVYDNTITGNNISGNGLAGVTVHAHSPGENLNGNIVRGNRIGTNNIDGDPDFGGNTPPAIDPLTTGVIVATAASPIAITIEGNLIENNHYGIWITPNVTATTSHPANVFIGVSVPVFTAP
jgi:parallel beta-helix repeat protein